MQNVEKKYENISTINSVFITTLIIIAAWCSALHIPFFSYCLSRVDSLCGKKKIPLCLPIARHIWDAAAI